MSVKVKLNGITSFCVAGEVIQPDENGMAVLSDAVLNDPDFIRLRSELPEGSIEEAQDAEPVKTEKKPKKTASDEK